MINSRNELVLGTATVSFHGWYFSWLSLNRGRAPGDMMYVESKTMPPTNFQNAILIERFDHSLKSVCGVLSMTVYLTYDTFH